MSTESVLVLNATGKVGRQVCRALCEAGFAVHGTTRSANSHLPALGVNPVVCNYTQRADLDRAFAQTGARKVGQHGAEVDHAEIHGHRYPQHASGLGVQFGQGLMGQLGLFNDAFAIVKVQTTTLGQLHPPRAAVEQAQAHIALQLSNPPRHRGGGHVQHLGGTAKAAGFGHLDKQLHVFKHFHLVIVPFTEQ